MLSPQLKFQIDEKTGEVACLASFFPSFDTKQSELEAKITCEAPEECSPEGKDFCFIFVVDRSGSMHSERMDITKQALQLFV
jgi:Mg-chelatase subunit ChlD